MTDKPSRPAAGEPKPTAHGTYGQADYSPAARRSQFRKTRAGEPSVPGAGAPPPK